MRSSIRTFSRAAVAALALALPVAPAAALTAAAQPASETIDPALAEDLRYARSLSNAFQHAASRIEGAVVHITKKSLTQRVRRDAFGRRYRVGQPSLVNSGLGSGVIFDAAEGLLLTNNHVIDSGDEFMARLSDGREVEATLVGTDPQLDLAVLRIDAANLTEADFGDSDDLRVGEWVLAVGSPFGIDQTVTAGIVSAIGRQLPGSEDIYQEYIQTDAAINPGNSGGPLINLEGQIVGINTAIVGRAQQSAGIGFAIPSLVVERAARAIVADGRVQRGWLGVEMTDLTAGERRELALGDGEGVRIAAVVPKSPAERAGLRAGDIVLSIDGRRVEGGQNRLRNLIALGRPGSEIEIVLRRGRADRTLVAVLGDLAASRLRLIAEETGGEVIAELRAVTRPMTTRRSRELGYVRLLPGDEIIALLPDSPALEAGVRPGDIITERRERQDDERRLVRLEIVRGGERGAIEIVLN